MGWFGFGAKIPKGAVVFCDLFGAVEHSGICIGDNEIIHLDGSGDIEKVDFYEFIARLNGLNDTVFKANLSYFVDEADNPIASKKFIKRAKNILGDSIDYNLFSNNCHKFTSGCITGDFDNSDTTFYELKDRIMEEFNLSSLYRINVGFRIDLDTKIFKFI